MRPPRPLTSLTLLACAFTILSACQSPDPAKPAPTKPSPPTTTATAPQPDASPAPPADPKTTLPSPAQDTVAAKGAITSDADLDALTIPALPDWVDRYADSNTGDMRFFNISKLSERFRLERHAAVELQNLYRDLSRTPDASTLPKHALFNRALARIQGGEYESKLALDRLSAAPFIVVFDLDETLFDQFYKIGDTCNDIAVTLPDATKRYVKLVPGWDDAIKRIRALGGEVVLFSANKDDLTYENLNLWLLDKTPLPNHPDIAGVLTNSHLILQEKYEGPGAQKPSRGEPVREPSKDLRIVDPSLSKVILIDDNPTRTFQPRNLRVFKKFDADAFCDPTTPEPVRTAFTKAMPTVAAEIEESVAYMKANPDTSFATAYLPYSSIGQVTLDNFVSTLGWTPTQAIDFIRKNPKTVDPNF
jgi:hypothetical protein